MTGRNLEWIRNFLSGRQQQVTVNGQISHCIPIISGIPQGGVLSGLMFVLYMNDLPNALKYLKNSPYAYDANFFFLPELLKQIREIKYRRTLTVLLNGALSGDGNSILENFT